MSLEFGVGGQNVNPFLITHHINYIDYNYTNTNYINTFIRILIVTTLSDCGESAGG